MELKVECSYADAQFSRQGGSTEEGEYLRPSDIGDSYDESSASVHLSFTDKPCRVAVEVTEVSGRSDDSLQEQSQRADFDQSEREFCVLYENTLADSLKQICPL